MNELYKSIIDNIKTKNGSKAIKKRQARNKYEVLSYPNLNLKDILCVPSSTVSYFDLLFRINLACSNKKSIANL